MLEQKGKVVVGKTIKKTFFIALLSGLLALGGLIAVFGFTGTAFALPMGGIGDFFVEFDELEGNGFELLPHLGETGESDSEPMVRNKIDSVEIKNLHIYKDLPLPGGEWVRFHIRVSGNTTIKGLIQDARFIDANLSFDELHIAEKNTDDFSKNWTQNAKTVRITDATIVTDYLFQSFVSLDGAKISAERIDAPKIVDDGN